MSKEKLIEIIADICPFYKEYGTCEQCNTDLDVDGEPCYWECMANAIINNGYRKQEWISVDERLPNEFVSVLGYMTDAGDFPPVRECYLVGRAFFFPALNDKHPVSHWMPLPEAPTMKGERV